MSAGVDVASFLLVAGAMADALRCHRVLNAKVARVHIRDGRVQVELDYQHSLHRLNGRESGVSFGSKWMTVELDSNLGDLVWREPVEV